MTNWNGPLPAHVEIGLTLCLALILLGCESEFNLPEGVLLTCQQDSDCVDGMICYQQEGICVTTTPVCGNRTVEIGEECDDGEETTECNLDCTEGECGDEVVNLTAGEECDDGNRIDTDSCLTTCLSAKCGDGIVEAGEEECDDGYTDSCGSCNNDCTGQGTGSVCGDGEVCQEIETCDYGSDAYACTACSSDCSSIETTSLCGDGLVCDETEACDDGYTDACGSCNEDCSELGPGSVCGDGVSCSEFEACDDGGITDAGLCNSDCSAEITIPDMVAVPSGSFQMGCMEAVDSNCEDKENPAHNIDWLPDFFIDTYEVTAGEYKECVDAEACVYYGGGTSTSTFDKSGKENHPINYVTWEEASSYCNWKGKDLPTEAQWEKAAKGPNSFKYPWGNSPEPSCNYALIHDLALIDNVFQDPGCGENGTQPVGTYPNGVSPYGAHDMLGSVWEIVSTLLMDYPIVENDGRDDLSCQTSCSIVIRGGGWKTANKHYLRNSYRDPWVTERINGPNGELLADPYSSVVGFRCVKSITPED